MYGGLALVNLFGLLILGGAWRTQDLDYRLSRTLPFREWPRQKFRGRGIKPGRPLQCYLRMGVHLEDSLLKCYL